MKRFFAFLAALICAGPATPHPHVFIDTGMTLRFDDDGRLQQIKVTWVYDEFYSLLVTEDMALDPDFDGVLTAEEIARLTGFDMNWIEGFNGDLEIYDGDDLLSLSGPIDPTASYADGRVTTTHVRDVLGDVTAGATLRVMPYDLTYYTAYDVTLPVVLEGPGRCTHRVDAPDLSEAVMELRAQLSTLDPNLTPEEAGMGNPGADLATKVYVSCPVS